LAAVTLRFTYLALLAVTSIAQLILIWSFAPIL